MEHSRGRVPSSLCVHATRRAFVFGCCGLALLPLLSRPAAQAPVAAERPPLEQVLGQLREKYKDGDKKYAALVAKVDKAVRKALATTPFPGQAPESPRFLDTHPYLRFVDELSAAVRAKPAKVAAPAADDILARHPCCGRLELEEGLEYGSDRPVPAHELGFIELGDLPTAPGLPEPGVNQYLFGLQEIVGWRACVVEAKKRPTFRARTPKDPPLGIETELPPWEALRVYLRGALPEVELFAIPRLTHLIHARLAERRRTADRTMDEMLALLDAHWNGFSFASPYSKQRTTIALPVFALIADRKGFVYHFPTGEHLSTTGDIPFVSDPTLKSYAQALRGESLEVSDFIAQAPKAVAVRDAFWRDCAYLSRYRALVELFVRAILEPESPLPACLEGCDFPPGQPCERVKAGELDVPRKHALLLWARAGKDPVELADYLYDQVFDLEANRFPKNVSLQGELAHFMRRRDEQFVFDLKTRHARERASPDVAGDYEREFSPHAQYLDPTSDASSDYLVHSHRTFHALVSAVVRDTAYAVVLAEVRGK